jgi:hypothetical protein
MVLLSFFFWQEGNYARCKRRHGHGLQPHLTGASERRQEQALAAELDVDEALHHFGGVVNPRFIGGYIAGIDNQLFAGRKINLAGARRSDSFCRPLCR